MRRENLQAFHSPGQLHWLQLTNDVFEINGLPWFTENGGKLSRLPLRSKSLFRPAVWSLAQSPSGARVRFRSDTTVLAVRLEYPSPPSMQNMHAFGQTGVDLYVDGVYFNTAVADHQAAAGKTYERILLNLTNTTPREREFALYLPLYKSVKVLGIGVESGAKFSRARKFARAKPVVFYGTSITQGGAASRPGMSYEAMLERKLNINFVNLGFSGNGLGEPEVARAVAEIDACCFVLDFGANHKSFEDMEKVYAPFLDTIRSAHPQIPIIAVTPLFTSREVRSAEFKNDWDRRRKYIQRVVQNRIKRGDKNLYLVDGAGLLGATGGDGLVDGSHPNDLGFYQMSEGLAPVLRHALKLH